MFTVLSHLVKPPAYLTMSCVGVDISDNSLKYVAFQNATRGGDKKIKSWGELDIPDGVVERGQVNDIAQLAGVMKEFKEQTGAEFVRLSLPEERAYLFETEIKQNVPFKEVRNLMEFRLEENVPIPSRDVLFDFSILPKLEHERSVRVAVAAYARETIERYHEACQAAGLFPVSFEVEAQAMARSMIPADASGAVMLLDFGMARTGVGIVYNDTLLYTSTIDVGGEQLSRVLRQVLGAEVAESELTKVKNTQGLIRGVESSDIRDALLGTVSVIKDELVARMQYWHQRGKHLGERRISSVIMCGGSANLRGLPEYLTEVLGVPCVRGNVWENAFSLKTTVPPIDLRHSYGYATAIGLALKHSV